MIQIKTGNFNAFVISNNQSFIFQVLKVVDPLGEVFDSFNPLGSDIESDSDLETSTVKLHSARA